MNVALEASRSEAAAMKVAYNYTNEKYEEVKQAYDSLIEQLKEEVLCLSIYLSTLSNHRLYSIIVFH